MLKQWARPLQMKFLEYEKNYPQIEIKVVNSNKNINFMIKGVRA